MKVITFGRARGSLLIAIMLISSGILFAGTAYRVSVNNAHAQPSTSIVSVNNAHAQSGAFASPSWVNKTQAYIHIPHYTASVDPAIKAHLTKQEIDQVNAAVAKYNSLPLTEKEPQTTTTNSSAVIHSVLQENSESVLGSAERPSNGNQTSSQTVPKSCQMVTSATTKWWGSEVYFNDCAVHTIVWALNVGAGIAGIIAVVCSPCEVIAGVIAAFLTIYAATLDYENNHCGGRGAYVEDPWIGISWIASIC